MKGENNNGNNTADLVGAPLNTHDLDLVPLENTQIAMRLL
jgi:hypothetical protein